MSTDDKDDTNGSGPPARERRHPSPNSLANLRPPWKPGQSGNPTGRKPEAKVRKYARRFDRRMVKVLAEIALNPKTDPDVRRKAACDLIDRGSGRPETTVQQNGPVVGVSVNVGTAATSGLSPEQVYRAMVAGEIPRDPSVFRPAIEADADEPDPAETADGQGSGE